MVLPFEPLSMTFQHVYYSVDVPPGSDVKGDKVTQNLVLLSSGLPWW